MAYKAQSLGEGAHQSEALGLGDRVNATLVSRKFTFLSGEICPVSTWFDGGTKPVGHLVERKSRHPVPLRDGVSESGSKPPSDKGADVSNGGCNRTEVSRGHSSQRLAVMGQTRRRAEHEERKQVV
jgi:hypothetical protein